jgi:hypothetical protein
LSRVIQFADGFTSASAPVVSGGSQENYTLLNNQTSVNITGLVFDQAIYKSAFISAEIERLGSSQFRQTVDIQLYWDGTTWNLTSGNSSGSDILNTAITSTEHVVLAINTSGQVSYSTGNLAGHTSSKIKLSIIRISA